MVLEICLGILKIPTASRLQWVKLLKVISILSLLFPQVYRLCILLSHSSQYFVIFCMICMIVSFKLDVQGDLSRYSRHCVSVYCEETPTGIYFIHIYTLVLCIIYIDADRSFAQEYSCLRIGFVHYIMTLTETHTIDT